MNIYFCIYSEEVAHLLRIFSICDLRIEGTKNRKGWREGERKGGIDRGKEEGR